MIRTTEDFFLSIYGLSRFYEEEYYPYLMAIMPYLNEKPEPDKDRISEINKKIIESDRNKKVYNDYFQGLSIHDFQTKVVDGSVQLVDQGSNGITLSVKKQHLIITFLEDYIEQVRKAKKVGILNFKEAKAILA